MDACPECGAAMVERTAKVGRLAGSTFYGCSTFPKCRGMRDVDGTDVSPRATNLPWERLTREEKQRRIKERLAGKPLSADFAAERRQQARRNSWW